MPLPNETQLLGEPLADVLGHMYGYGQVSLVSTVGAAEANEATRTREVMVEEREKCMIMEMGEY